MSGLHPESIVMKNAKKFRWAWMISLLLLAGFMINSVSNYLVSRKHIRQTITESSLPLTSDNIYSEIQRDLLRPVFISSLMAQDTFLRDWVIEGETDPKQIVKFLHEIKTKYGTISSFFISDKTLTYYHADGVLKTISPDDARDKWYYRVKNMSTPYEINVDPDLANLDAMTIFINYRVYDYYGSFIGATGVGLTVTRVNELISDYETRYSRQIYFTSSTGSIVLVPSNGPMKHYSRLQEVPGLGKFVSQILDGSPHKIRYKREGKTRFLNSRYVPELGWYLIVEQAEDSMLAPLRRQLYDNLLIALVLSVIVAWIGVSTISRYQRSLEKRNDELKELLDRNSAQKQELEDSSRELEETNSRLSALNHEKDEIMSLVAHDLRNPLNGIVGMCDLAESGSDSGQFQWKDFIRDVQSSAQRMNTLIKNLLNASNLESGNGTTASTETDLQSLLEDTIDTFRSHVASKRISLKTEFSHRADLSIVTQPEWLSICLNNLLSNALKYSPPCGSVTIRTQVDDDQDVTIDFIDSGPGISVEDQKKLFGKFERLSAKPTNGESSTGLGLYLVRKICDRIHITIEVESRLGEGSRFTLRIPLHPESKHT